MRIKMKRGQLRTMYRKIKFTNKLCKFYDHDFLHFLPFILNHYDFIQAVDKLIVKIAIHIEIRVFISCFLQSPINNKPFLSILRPDKCCWTQLHTYGSIVFSWDFCICSKNNLNILIYKSVFVTFVKIVTIEILKSF